jgi:two-component system sensor histidine kinase AlgZ
MRESDYYARQFTRVLFTVAYSRRSICGAYNMTNDAAPFTQSRSQSSYWICQCVGWGVYTLMKIYGAVAIINLPWVRATAETLLLSGAGLGLTHWLRHYMSVRHWSTLKARKLVWRIVVAGFVLGIPLGLITPFTSISAMQDPGEFLQGATPAFRLYFTPAVTFALHITNWACLFLIWLAIYFVAIAMRRHRWAELRQSELARALQQAELRLLKSQLNPHFLFNALNTVRSLIADDPTRAQRAVTHLANTLRYTLRSGQDELVTLAQELEIVADYLALESMRFEERLIVEYDVPADAGSVPIPVMLLQTVVENAIKHGIAELPSGGVLRISAALRDGTLFLQVENSRPPDARSRGEGMGLRNSEERLRLLFGPGASLDLDLSQSAMVTTRIRIPQHR